VIENFRRQFGAKQKLLLAAAGAFLFLILLELGMRAGAQVILYVQGQNNTAAAQKQGAFRILCLGESTTALGGADSYPAQLERILDIRGGGRKFAVFNEGIVAAHTQAIISRLENMLDKYHPDMVIAMMGINDGYADNIPYIKGSGHGLKLSDFFMSLKIVKLARFIGMNIRQRGTEIHASDQYASDGKAYMEAALLSRNQGKFGEAAAAFRQALALAPKDDMLYMELGCTYMFQGDYAAAQDVFQKGIEVNRGNDSLYYWFGVLCMKQGKTQPAEESFNKSARINPLNDRAYGGLGTLYGSLNEKERALQSYRMADRVRSEYYNPGTRHSFRQLKEVTGSRGVKLVCVQYPMRSVEPLKKIFNGYDSNIMFVDNESAFKAAVDRDGYQAYFTDMFAGDFGHCTEKGNRLLAENVADIILK